MSNDSLLREPSRLLYGSPLIEVGEFQCPCDHPLFANPGPAERYCFVFPRTAVWIQHEGRKPFVADPTVVTFFNLGDAYTRRAISRHGDRADWFGTSAALLREILQLWDPAIADAGHRLFRFDFSRVDSAAFLRQRRIAQHVKSEEPPDALYVEESTIAILEAVLLSAYGPSGAGTDSRQRDLVEAAKVELNLTLASEQGLNRLARTLGASVFHLCRVFRQHSGLSIHRYRSELRLRRALEMLGDHPDDILTTALALGYSGHSHFTRAFRRAFGITPSRYRGMAKRDRRAIASTHPLPATFNARHGDDYRREQSGRREVCHVLP